MPNFKVNVKSGYLERAERAVLKAAFKTGTIGFLNPQREFMVNGIRYSVAYKKHDNFWAGIDRGKDRGYHQVEFRIKA